VSQPGNGILRRHIFDQFGWQPIWLRTILVRSQFESVLESGCEEN
jgi:hypothetical protein